jgi:hypothetical protein
MQITMTIPENVVGQLRSGARRSLLGPIRVLSEIAERRSQVERPIECSRAQLKQLVRRCELLDALGWNMEEAFLEATIDLSEHRVALCEALTNALTVAIDEVKAADPVMRRQVGQGLSALYGFAVVIDAVDVEGADERDSRLWELSMQATALLQELDRGCARGQRSEPQLRGVVH